MNQEKLAKLQAQVRIGGKVRLQNILQIHCTLILFSQFKCPLYLGYSTPKEEGCPQNGNSR